MPSKKALMYGAGNIGRGFIGQLLYESGYETVFVDVDDEVVNAINTRHSYPLRILADNVTDLLIEGVSAVHGNNTEQIAECAANVDLIATAVGAGVLPRIAKPIAAGLTQRFENGGAPLDILVCENRYNAGDYLRQLIAAHIPESAKAWFNENVGLVETSIGRMVPLQTPELKDGDFLRICVEEYASLPVDKDAFKAPIPDIRGLLPYSPFSFYVERKLYIHNMGHALTAYCGDYLGLHFIWESIGSPVIFDIAKGAMTASANALAERYKVEVSALLEHVDDLLRRFANQRLGDTVYRVGRDLRRKLAADDRMAGALSLCRENSAEQGEIMLGIALALRFSANELDMPPESVLTEICGIGGGEKAAVLELYQMALKGENLEKIHERST